MALVVSPLRSLMQDQLRRCREMGIAAVVIGRINEMSAAEKLSMCLKSFRYHNFFFILRHRVLDY